MSTITAWEPGLTCEGEGCGGEFAIGEDVFYWYGRRMHARCASRDAAARREQAGDGSALGAALAQVAAGGRVVLARRQVRELAEMARDAGLVPVRRPDAGRQRWYGRMPGWSAERVEAGLRPAEIAGMWLDFLDDGRMPPLKLRDLEVIIAAIGPQKGQESRSGGQQ